MYIWEITSGLFIGVKKLEFGKKMRIQTSVTRLALVKCFVIIQYYFAKELLILAFEFSFVEHPNNKDCGVHLKVSS